MCNSEQAVHLIVIYNIATILTGDIPQVSLLLPTVKQLVCKV